MYIAAPYSDIVTDLPTIRGLGITLIMNYQYPQWEPDTVAFLDACHALGMRAILNIKELCKKVGGPDYTAIDAHIVAYKDHQALYGWYTDDETSGAAYPISVRESVYDFIKARDNKPVLEVHWHYDADAYSDQAHDLFGIDRYPWLNIPGINLADGLTNIESNLAREYGYMTDKDRANLMFAIQAYGDSEATLPPVGGIIGSYNQVKPEWFTWGVGFYTWISTTNPSGDTYAYPWEHSYIRYEIRTVCADVLGVATVDINQVLDNDTNLIVSGYCSSGCKVMVGSYRASVDLAGTSWTATVPSGNYTVVASNGITTTSVTLLQP
jgi:hypothetical protein